MQMNGLFLQDIEPSISAQFVLDLDGSSVGLRHGALWLNEQAIGLASP